MQFFSTIASLVACVSAYQVLTPTVNSTITKGSTVNVQFSTVNTDASTFSVYLVNFATGHFPPLVLSLAQNVAQNAGSVNVRIPCSVDNDSGYQLNFINGTNTYVIYAQSATFSITGSCTDPVVPTTSAVAYSNTTISTVQTIIYSNPVVWFVQPSNLVAAAAICPPASQQTVTVQAGAAAVTVRSTSTVTVQAGAAAATVVSTATVTRTVTSCPSQAAIVSALAAAAAQGGNQAAVPAAATSSVASRASASVAASGVATGVPVVSSLPRSSTSGATQVGGAVVALFGAVAVMLL